MASFRIRGGHMKRIHRIESVAGGLLLLALAGPDRSCQTVKKREK